MLTMGWKPCCYSMSRSQGSDNCTDGKGEHRPGYAANGMRFWKELRAKHRASVVWEMVLLDECLSGLQVRGSTSKAMNACTCMHCTGEPFTDAWPPHNQFSLQECKHACTASSGSTILPCFCDPVTQECAGRQARPLHNGGNREAKARARANQCKVLLCVGIQKCELCRAQPPGAHRNSSYRESSAQTHWHPRRRPACLSAMHPRQGQADTQMRGGIKIRATGLLQSFLPRKLPQHLLYTNRPCPSLASAPSCKLSCPAWEQGPTCHPA